MDREFVRNQVQWYNTPESEPRMRYHQLHLMLGLIPKWCVHLNVCDVGCGARGGVFGTSAFTPEARAAMFQGPLWVGVDPLWGDYSLSGRGPFVRVIGTAAQWHVWHGFDVVYCVNTLQYEPEILRFCGELERHLLDEGHAIIHMPCRTQSQTSRSHPYYHDPNVVLDTFAANFTVEFGEICDTDPLEPGKPYRTLVAHLRKNKCRPSS